MLKTIAQADIQFARQALSMLDTSLAKANEVVPVFEWPIRANGFSGLVRLIIEQQVSMASANSVWNRLNDGLGTVDSAHVLSKKVEGLKQYGLSTPKAQYVYGIANAHVNGEIDFNALQTLDDDTAITKLMTLKGVGQWTAEAYLMWCEARTNVFLAADIALAEAIRILDKATHRPSTQELYHRSIQWSPYRSFAVHLLWNYYLAIKKCIIAMPEGVPVLIKAPK
jgi:DNA-3-methyladenine glycosylase II